MFGVVSSHPSSGDLPLLSPSEVHLFGLKAREFWL